MSESTERWLPVVGYEGFYEVSNWGRVRSVRHMTAAGWRGGKILNPFLDRDGYFRVNLSKHGVIKGLCPVHNLVLQAFAGPPTPGQQGRHGIGGRQNNRWPENLCWGTPQENSDDKYRDGTMACGERQGNAKLRADDIRAIRFRASTGESTPSLADCFSISQVHVRRIIFRESWRHITD
jgi:NUMOD4 motif